MKLVYLVRFDNILGLLLLAPNLKKKKKSIALYPRTVQKFHPVVKGLIKPANRNRVRRVDKEMTSSKLRKSASWASPASLLCQKL